MNKNYFLLLAFFCFFKINAQQPGDLDTSFGTNGTLRLNLWNATFNVKSHVVLPDGKFILAGEIKNEFFDSAFLVRLLANGEIDETFGDGGKVVHPFVEGFNIVKLQPDGKIIVGGHYENNYAVARFLANGNLDSAFAYDGTYYDLDANINPNLPNPVKDLEIQSDNKIVVLTTIDVNNVKNFRIFRLNSNGILDTTLDIVEFFDSGDIPVALSIQPDGKFVMAGYNSINSNIFVLRFNTSGSLDTSFNSTGYRLFSINNALFTVIKDLQLQSDGKILICGKYNSNGNSLMTILRLNSNSTFDSTFSGNGIQSVVVNVDSNSIGKIAIQSNGKILQMDTIYDSANNNEDMLVIRYNADGELDTTFNNGSPGVQLDLNNLRDKAACISIDNNKLIISGNTELSDVDNRIAVSKFNLDPISLDNSFGDEGVAEHFFPFPTNEAIIQSVIQSDNKIVVLAYVFINNARRHCIERFNEDGSLDETFGVNGKLIIGNQAFDFHGLAVDSQNRIIVTGIFSSGLILRITPQGTLDTTFGNQGFTYLEDDLNFYPIFNSIKFQSDNKIILAGTNSVNNIDDYLLVRLNSNGTIDSTFGINGISSNGSTSSASEEIHAIQILNDGKIIASGHALDSSNTPKGVVLKYNSIGLLDPTFGNNGKVITNVSVTSFYGKSDIKVQTDGKILSTFEATDDNLVMYRMNPNGTYDSFFGSNGKVETNITGSDISSQIHYNNTNQKITLIGTASTNEMSKFLLVRYSDNGDVDSSFGDSGVVITDFEHNVQAICASQTSDGKLVVSGVLQDVFTEDLDQVYAKYHLDETLSTQNSKSIEIQLYPNPVKDKLFVSFKNGIVIPKQYVIMDISGKVITSGELVLEQGINVSNLTQGIYFITVDDFNSIKFVKQ